MIETAQEYTQRLRRTLGNQAPLEVLESTPSNVEALGKRLDGDGWKKLREGGRWTAAQILAHLAEGEIVLGYRIRTILGANGCDIQAYDQEVWVKNAGYLESDPGLAMTLFQALRKANVARLRSLSNEQLNFYGLHSERGKESIADMMTLIAGHDINHLRQIESIR